MTEGFEVDVRVEFATGRGFSRMRVHYPYGRDAALGHTVIVRTTGDPAALIPAVQNRIRTIDKDLSIQRMATATDLLGENLAEPRFYLRLLGCFALVTLVLAALGIYGVMAHSVAQRTREIGIRMALGAMRRDIMTLVLGRGLALALGGLLLGSVAARALAHTMTAVLFDASPNDLPTFVSAGLVLLTAASLAAWIPARRAARAEPLVALRHE